MTADHDAAWAAAQARHIHNTTRRIRRAIAKAEIEPPPPAQLEDVAATECYCHIARMAPCTWCEATYSTPEESA